MMAFFLCSLDILTYLRQTVLCPYLIKVLYLQIQVYERQKNIPLLNLTVPTCLCTDAVLPERFDAEVKHQQIRNCLQTLKVRWLRCICSPLCCCLKGKGSDCENEGNSFTSFAQPKNQIAFGRKQ